MPDVHVEGHRLHYHPAGERGSGPGRGVVVFVHGAGGNGEHWRAQLQALPPGWRGLALDLPGHGHSAGAGCRTLAEYRDVVRPAGGALPEPPGVRRLPLAQAILAEVRKAASVKGSRRR